MSATISTRRLPEYEIEGPSRSRTERARFRPPLSPSRSSSCASSRARRKSLPRRGGARRWGYLLDAHLSMLSNSRLVRGRRQAHRQRAAQRPNGPVQTEIAAIGRELLLRHARPPISRGALRTNIRIVGMRLIPQSREKRPFEALSRISAGRATVILRPRSSPPADNRADGPAADRRASPPCPRRRPRATPSIMGAWPSALPARRRRRRAAHARRVRRENGDRRWFGRNRRHQSWAGGRFARLISASARTSCAARRRPARQSCAAFFPPPSTPRTA